MPHTSPWYRAGAYMASRLVPAAGLFVPKLGRGHAARTGLVARLESWARQNRETDRPLVWFHAPSVGEGLQAESVITAFARRHPEWQVAYTYFSPSAEPWATRLPVDVRDYLPYDVPADVERVIAALSPSALVFTKLDLWPELATRAAARGIKVLLAAGTVRPGSSRLRWPARGLLQPGYAVVEAAGVIAAEDGERLVRLGVPRRAIHVTGDPRMDSVDRKVRAVPPDEPLLRMGDGASTMVAGSTWGSDEHVILSAFARIRREHREGRLILVPHEPTEGHLHRLASRAAALGLSPPVRLSTLEGSPGELIVVDRIGILATLYGAGSMAYVGGGFRRAGLHSVLEPAAWGLPVAFGPRWRESRDARLLERAGAGHPIASEVPRRAIDQLATIWARWLADAAARDAEGRLARQVIDRELGAAERTVDLIDWAMTGSNPTVDRSPPQRGTMTPS